MSSTTRKRAVRAVAPVAGLLAAGLLVWQGSYAAFSATTVNQGDAWATGNMVLANNGGGTSFAASTSALFNETALEFGDGGTKCITVRSSGSVGGDLRLYRGAVIGSAALATQLAVTVEAVSVADTVNVAADCAGFPADGSETDLYSGALSGLQTSWTNASGTSMTVPDGAQRVAYRITWQLQSTNDNNADNALQGQTATVDLNWEMQS